MRSTNWHNFHKSCDPWSRMQFLWKCFSDHHKKELHISLVKILKRDRKGRRAEWGRMEVLREALSCKLVPWWRDTMQWEKSCRQNKTSLLSVLTLCLPPSSDIHPYPPSLGQETSSWTQQFPKKPLLTQKRRGKMGCELTGTSPLVLLSAAGRGKGQGP